MKRIKFLTIFFESFPNQTADHSNCSHAEVHLRCGPCWSQRKSQRILEFSKTFGAHLSNRVDLIHFKFVVSTSTAESLSERAFLREPVGLIVVWFAKRVSPWKFLWEMCRICRGLNSPDSTLSSNPDEFRPLLLNQTVWEISLVKHSDGESHLCEQAGRF